MLSHFVFILDFGSHADRYLYQNATEEEARTLGAKIAFGAPLGTALTLYLAGQEDAPIAAWVNVTSQPREVDEEEPPETLRAPCAA